MNIMGNIITEHLTECLVIAIIVLILILVLCLFAKIIRTTIAIAFLCLLSSIMATIFWGDGTAYVNVFSSMFAPKYAEEITDAYQHFKKIDAQDPFFDSETVKENLRIIVQENLESNNQ